MRADDRLSAVLTISLEGHARKLKKRLRLAEHGDVEGVHDSRTLLRRLRVELDIMGRTLFDRAQTDPVQQRLRRLEKALSKPRDSDVLLAGLDTYLRERATARRPLTELRLALKRRRKNSARDAGDALSRRSRRKALRELRALQPVAGNGPDDAARASPKLLRHFTHEEAWHWYDAARAYDEQLSRGPEVLHRFRSACRGLRFALELFAEGLPEVDGIIQELHAIQDQIGELHDHWVAVRLIEKWKARGKLHATDALEAFKQWHQAAADALRTRYLQDWQRVLTEEFRTRLAQALETESPEPPQFRVELDGHGATPPRH